MNMHPCSSWRAAALAGALLLSACAGKQVEPAWRSNASSALDNFTAAYLEGSSALAASDFARARAALGSTGQAELVAHAELVRCAAMVASVANVANLASAPSDGGAGNECAGFAPLAPDATPAQRSYAAYLAGRWQDVDAALLPLQHQAIVRSASPALTGVTDPLSRLVAAGAMLQAGRLTPPDITVAIDTASQQGWRRPLLAWLGIAVQRARAGGDVQEVARLERRIALASGK